MEHRIVYEIMRKEVPVAPGSAPRYAPARIADAGFAAIYMAQEVVYDMTSGGKEVDRRDIVAKIFLDERSEQAINSAYESERDVLERLRHPEHIVGLRAYEHNRPPTFFCTSCGRSFDVLSCPDCNGRLIKGGPPNDHQTTHRDLVCTGGAARHVFHNTPEHIVRLQKKNRKCRCDEPCGINVVNFSFTHSLFLDRLDSDLYYFRDLLTNPEESRFGVRIRTISKFGEDGYLRETFLMRLHCLIQVAEALEYLHRHDKVHGDLSPSNIMVSIVDPPADNLPQRHHVRLIDFGVSREWKTARKTTTALGREEFSAPEVKRVKDQLEPTAKISRDQVTEKFYISTTKRLGEGDFIQGSIGRFEVLKEEPLGDGSRDVAGGGERKTAPPGRREPTLRRIDVRRYELKSIESSGGSAELVQLYWTQAIRIPADMYSFGSVATWLAINGDEDNLKRLRQMAELATSEGRTVSEIVGRDGDTLIKEIRALMPLPDTPEDEEVRSLVIDVIMRCLIRGPDAYCASRSTPYNGAAARAATDLRVAYDQLFLKLRATERYMSFVARLHEQVVEFEKLVAKLKMLGIAAGVVGLVSSPLIALALGHMGIIAISRTRPEPIDSCLGTKIEMLSNEIAQTFKPAPPPQRCSQPNAVYFASAIIKRANEPQVTFPDICVDVTEVTVGVYDGPRMTLSDTFLWNEQSYDPNRCNHEGDPGAAINCMSPAAADEYCVKKGGRLPTEAEWERVARADGEKFVRPWGSIPIEDWNQVCVQRPGPCYARPDKTLDRTGAGIYGMVGNVAEWVVRADGSEAQERRYVIKGGSYRSRRDNLEREMDNDLYKVPISGGPARWRGSFVGFRCVYEPLPLK